MLGILAALQQVEDERLQTRRDMQIRRAVMRDSSNPFLMGDDIFKRHYRMYPWMALEFLQLIHPFLPLHELGVRPDLQVLAVMRFLAEGPYQKGAGNEFSHPMSQPTFSKYLHVVIPAINRLRNRFIVFPRTREERERVQERFRERIGFSGVIGAIDGTLIRIITPSDHEEAYVDRHNRHSLNVQMTCDMDYRVTSLRICNGSTNDQFAWRNSELYDEMFRLRNNIQAEGGPYYLIGDGGYTLSRVLLTPVPAADAVRGTPAHAYNRAQRGTRVKMEQTNGIIKERWRCLNGGKLLYYHPRFAAEIIESGVILHNFLIEHGMPLPPVQLVARDNHNVVHQLDNEYYEGLRERQQIIDNHFQNGN